MTGVPEAYKILYKDIRSQKQVVKETMAKMAGTSSQNEGYSSKWLIWLVCREPLCHH